MNNKKYFFVGIFVLVVALGFVLAAAGAPADLIITNNVSSTFDEGSFNVNWTAGVGDASVNYTVFVWKDGVLNTVAAQNDSGGPTYTFSNATTGNYSFTIQAHNATGCQSTAGFQGCTNSTSNVSIIVDADAPTGIDLAGFTNNTFKTSNTDTFTLNVTITDALSGGNATTVEFYYLSNGSSASADASIGNQTVVGALNGSTNVTTWNLTGLPDGNYSITVHANDSVGNFAVNHSFFHIGIDSTIPTATSSCSPTTVQTGDSFPCSCSGSDTTSGISTASGSSDSPDGTSTPSSTGTFTYTCTVTDASGNSASSSKSYTVTQIPGTPSDSLETTDGTRVKSLNLVKITPGVASIVKDFDSDTGLKEIQINVNNEVQNVKVSVTKYDEKPAEVSISKSGKIFQYLQIELDNIGNSLDKAIVKSKVKKSWVSENGLTKEEVSMFKFDEDNDKWNELKTEFESEDDTYYYYSTEVDSFSYFAISEKVLVEDEGTPADEETEVVSSDDGKNLTWLWILVIVVVLIAIGFSVKKKK